MAAASVVQVVNTSHITGKATSYTVALTGVGAGHSLLLANAGFGTAYVSSVSDNAGTPYTWKKVEPIHQANTASSSTWWIGTGGSSGSVTVTVTLSATGFGSGCVLELNAAATPVRTVKYTQFGAVATLHSPSLKANPTQLIVALGVTNGFKGWKTFPSGWTTHKGFFRATGFTQASVVYKHGTTATVTAAWVNTTAGGFCQSVALVIAGPTTPTPTSVLTYSFRTSHFPVHAYAATLTITTTNVGDIVAVLLNNQGANRAHPTGMSDTNSRITWFPAATCSQIPVADASQNFIWLGTVKSAGATKLHVTWNAAVTVQAMAAFEFGSTLGSAAKWVVVNSSIETPDHWKPYTTNLPFPPVWSGPSAGVYMGYEALQTTPTVGTTSGITYVNYSQHGTSGFIAAYDASISKNTTYSPLCSQPTSTGGNINGCAVIFRAITGKPTVATESAVSYGGTVEVVTAKVNPQGHSTTVKVQYGATNSYGSTTTSINIGSGTTAVLVHVPVTGLTTGNTYHYRVAATNTIGTTNGTDATFKTVATPGPSGILGKQQLGTPALGYLGSSNTTLVVLAGTSTSTSTLSGALTTGPLALAGTSTSTSTLSASLTVQAALAGTSTSTSTLSGALTTGPLALAGTSTSTSTLSGVLTGPLALAGTSTSVSTVSGTLTVSMGEALAGTSTSVSTLSAALTTGPLALAGTSTSVSTLSGALTTGPLALAGTSSSVSTLSGALTTGPLALAGTSTSVSSLSGTLTVGSGVALTGTSTSTSTLSANLTVKLALAGTSTSVSTLSGTLIVSHGETLAGTSTSTSVLNGTLTTGPLHLAGTSTSVSTLSGALSVPKHLAATSTSTSTISANISVPLALAGTSTSVSSANAAITTGPIHLSGTATGISTMRGNLTVGLPFTAGTATVTLAPATATVTLVSSSATVRLTPAVATVVLT